MSRLPGIPAAVAGILLSYLLFVLWMAAGLLAVFALVMVVNGGLTLARHGDRPLEDWPILRRLLQR